MVLLQIGSCTKWIWYRIVLVHNGSGTEEFWYRIALVQNGSGTGRFWHRMVPVQDGFGMVLNPERRPGDRMLGPDYISPTKFGGIHSKD